MHTAEESKKNYREFRTGNLKFELFNLISLDEKFAPTLIQTIDTLIDNDKDQNAKDLASKILQT